MIKDQLERALDIAVTEHFCKLFDVLMAGSVNDSVNALERFKNGVARLIDAEATVKLFIDKGDQG